MQQRWFAIVGVVGNVAAVVGWMLAVTNGISFIDGLEVAEDPGLGDGMAAALALVAFLCAVAWLVRSTQAVLAAAVIAIVALAVAAMIVPSEGHGDHGSHSEPAEGVADNGHAGH